METFLFTNEEIIARTDKDTVVLTTHRLRYSPSRSQVTSVMLDAVVGIDLRYRSHAIFAWLSCGSLLAAIGSMVERHGPAAVGSGVLMILFLLLYFSSRKHVLKIATSKLAIDIHVVSMKPDEILNFINHIEMAREGLLRIAVGHAHADAGADARAYASRQLTVDS